MCKISVIVPVYNVEKYLERCIKSILYQTYQNLEIILIDDGSTDNSGKICDTYAQIDNRIKVYHGDNVGAGMARNVGLDIATGEYITFIDSDDYIGNMRLADMIKNTIKTGADTCMTGFTKVYGNKKITHKHTMANRIIFDGFILTKLLPKMCGANEAGNDHVQMSVSMVLFSNNIIKKNNLRFVSEKEMISEDLIFDFEYYPLATKVCVIDKVDYFYCHNEKSLTTRYKPGRYEAQVVLYKNIRKRAAKLGIEKECVPRLDNTLVAIARYSIKLEEKFMYKNGINITIANIRRICNDELLQTVFTELNTKGLKKTSKVVNYMIKRKLIWSLIATMRFKNIFGI